MKKMHYVVIMMLSLVLTFSVSTAFSAPEETPAASVTPATPATPAAPSTPSTPAKEVSAGEPATVPTPHSEIADKININTADEATLIKIKGIGPKKAKDIIAYRQEHGNFTSIDDLKKIKGFGPKVFEQIKPHITL